MRNAEYKYHLELNFATELAMRVSAKLQKPQRLLTLTSDQERHRYKCTCQHFAWVMHLVDYGSKDQLKQYVSDPEKVISMRRRCVLVFIDQVPWFVKVKSSQQLYHDSETKRSSHRRNAEMHTGSRFSQAASQTAEAMINEDFAEGQTQKRGEADQCMAVLRITLYT